MGGAAVFGIAVALKRATGHTERWRQRRKLLPVANRRLVTMMKEGFEKLGFPTRTTTTADADSNHRKDAEKWDFNPLMIKALWARNAAWSSSY